MAQTVLRNRPTDWPAPSAPIDLAVQDLPHASSTLEWWYINGHLSDDRGRQLALFASFFRTAVAHDTSSRYHYAHALTWALIDVSGGRYLSESLVDRDAPAISAERLDRGLGPKDPRVRRALREVIERGNVPLPDRLLRNVVRVDEHRLSIDCDGRRFERRDDGRYALELRHGTHAARCTLLFELRKPVITHGDAGVVAGSASEDMFYYFCPRCAVEGEVVLDGLASRVVEGALWYDHEFGAGGEDLRSDDAPSHDVSGSVTAGGPTVGWNWLSAQLDDGWDVTVYDLVEVASGVVRGHFAITVSPEGERREYREFTLEGDEHWTSTRTFLDYPTRWRLVIPEAAIELEARAAFAQQEFMTFIARSAFWEGRVDVSGTRDGRPVSGRGFVERANFGERESLETFFADVGRATQRSVRQLLPRHPSPAEAARLVASAEDDSLLAGVDAARLGAALIAPIREIVDRGGKAWRSYCALAVCDALGGDSAKSVGWLAIPELLHVGSLIVDDVQDGSFNRRGGPACHEIHGLGTAINAGNFCYFTPQLYLAQADLSDAQRLRIYELYIQAVRAAHCGQALDIHGFADLLADAVARGDGVDIETQVLAVHRLKSAVPAGALGRIGGVIAGGTEAQIEAAGTYLESVGVAFQIVDDALNLRGFREGLKDTGEDIRAGKITVPIAKALSRLDRPGRQRLAETLSSRTDDAARLAEAIALVEACGALDACQAEAEARIEAGWRPFDAVVPDSYFKVYLRAFGSFVLDRHY